MLHSSEFYLVCTHWKPLLAIKCYSVQRRDCRGGKHKRQYVRVSQTEIGDVTKLLCNLLCNMSSNLACRRFTCLSLFCIAQKDSAAMLAIKRSAGVTPQVNLRNPYHTGDEAGKQETHPGFETQGRCHQSKTEVSVAPQKGLISSKIFLKNRKEKVFTLLSICTRRCSLCKHLGEPITVCLGGGGGGLFVCKTKQSGPGGRYRNGVNANSHFVSFCSSLVSLGMGSTFTRS